MSLDRATSPGDLRLDFQRRLGADWVDVVTALEIPAHDRARFEPGREAEGIWDWLQRRNRLDLLAGALTSAGRDDLVPVVRDAIAAAPRSGGGGGEGGEGSDRDVLNAYLHGPSKEPAARSTVAGRPPQVWNLEIRNPGFAGRDRQLAAIHAKLTSGKSVQALYGMGGIGKTQLAIEYAYRHADDYDTVWWIAAEQAGLIELPRGDGQLRRGVPGGAERRSDERAGGGQHRQLPDVGGGRHRREHDEARGRRSGGAGHPQAVRVPRTRARAHGPDHRDRHAAGGMAISTP